MIHGSNKNSRIIKTGGRARALLAITAFLLTALLVACAGFQGGKGSQSARGEQEESTQSGRDGQEESTQSARGEDSAVLELDDNVLHGTLKNGITYYIRRNEKPKNRLKMRLVVDAGSVLEKENERGLAHFVEHMAFNGTENYDKHGIIDYLEGIGMSFGPDINAYTGFDETVYSLDIPTEKEERVRKGIDILEEWAFRIAFDPKEVDKERKVIVEEWRSGRGASARLRDRWWPVLAEGSIYAKRLPIGKMEVVKNAPTERLEGFYRNWYVPDSMAVVAVGDMDPEKALEIIREKFAGSERSTTDTAAEETRGPSYPVPAPEERKVVVATDPEASNVHIRLFSLHEPFVPKTEEEYKDLLSIRLYRSMVSSRLSELSQQEDPPFINGYFSRGPLVRSKDASYWGAVAYEKEIEKALRAILTESRRVDLYGFTGKELERAKKKLKKSYEQAYEERDTTSSSSFLGEYTRHFLTGETAPGIEEEWRLVKELLPKIDKEEIERIHKKYMKNRPRVLVITGPEKEGLEYPDEGRIDSLIEKVEKSSVEPYSDDFEGTSLLAEKPEKGAIVEREHYKEGDYHRIVLENGAEVLYKNTEFKKDQILFSAFSAGGSSRVKTENYYTAMLAPNLVQACGLGDFSPVELNKLLAGHQAQLTPRIGSYFERLSGNTRPEDLELLFQKLHLLFTDLRENKGLFSSYKSRLASAIKNRRSSPSVKYQDAIGEMLFDNHPRSRPLTSKKVKNIEMKKTFDIFRERFSDPGGFTYVFVGNVDPEKIESFSRSYIAPLAEESGESWKDRGMHFSNKADKVEVFAGQEPKSKVSLFYVDDYQWSIEENNALASLESLLEIRLREAVREEAGGTYGVSVSTRSNKIAKEEYALSISFSCDPERVDELISIVEKELETVSNKALEASYAEKVRQGRKSDWEEAKEENGYWLGLLTSSRRYGIPMQTLMAKGKRIERISPEMLKESAEKYISGAVRLEAILYPESFEKE